MVNMDILWPDFVIEVLSLSLPFGHGKFYFGHDRGRNFDHLTSATLKYWTWSNIFNHMTITPGCRPDA